MKTLLAIALAAGTMLAGAAQATVVYTADGNLAHFTNGISDYATFSNFHDGDAPGGSPYTPTTTTLNHDYRVFNWSGDPVSGLSTGNWILATFTDAESAIRLFPNIDHLGENFDGYQYKIYGSNNGTSWTELYDTLTVAGSGEPFTIGTYFGTAPTRVNNVLTPGLYHDAPGGQVGYIADFKFGTGYKQFALGTSTAAWMNTEQEFSAVAAIPEPASWALMILGFGGVGGALRRRRQALAA
jgi:hypothetical protein